MANWSDVTITFNFTNIFQMKSIIKDIQSYIKDDYFSVAAGSMEINTFDYDYKALYFTLHGEGRWRAPVEYFKKIALEHKLSGKLIDLEAGNDFFYHIQWKNGNIIKEVYTPYLSKESIDALGVDYFHSLFEWILEQEDELTKEDIVLLKYAGYLD